MRFGMLVVASLVLLGAAANRALTFDEQVSEFRERSMAARTKLGTGRGASIHQLFGTPELVLQGEPPALAPGKAATIKASGTLPKGSLVLFDCPQLQVGSLKQTTHGVVAQVKAAPYALARDCLLYAYAPITAYWSSIRAARIESKYDWHLELANGMKVLLASSPEAGGKPALARWTQGETTVERRLTEWRDDSRAGKIHARVERTDEDQQILQSRWDGQPRAQELTALRQKRRELKERMDQCSGLTFRDGCYRDIVRDPTRACVSQLGGVPVSADMLEKCWKAAKKAHDDASREIARLEVEQRSSFDAHPTGCDAFELSEDPVTGKVEGRALGCNSTAAVPLSGSLSAAR